MNKEEIYSYNKIFSIIRKTDLLDLEEKDKLHIYLMNLKDQNKQLKGQKEELKKWLENYFQGKTIDNIPVDDFYKKGMYRMMEYTLDKIKELEEGVN